MKKRTAAALMAAMMAFTGLLLGSAPAKPEEQPQTDNRLKIVCTSFPAYDWVREILGETDAAELTLLTENGVDLHSYQPSAADMIRITDSDLFLYLGGSSDQWVQKMQSSPEMTRKSLSLMDALGEARKEEEWKEGMQAERHAHEEEEEIEYDEHVWLSVKNAEKLCGVLVEALAERDAEHAEQYRQNGAAYLEKLAALDEAYQQMVENSTYRTLLFADRFPFRYLADDYGLEYYAAFAGCSAETEASFETIVFLARKLEQEQLPAVLVLENSNQSLAKTIIRSTKARNQQILVLQSMQSVNREQMAQGVSYLSWMEQNLSVLKQALNG